MVQDLNKHIFIHFFTQEPSPLNSGRWKTKGKSWKTTRKDTTPSKDRKWSKATSVSKSRNPLRSEALRYFRPSGCERGREGRANSSKYLKSTLPKLVSRSTFPYMKLRSRISSSNSKNAICRVHGYSVDKCRQGECSCAILRMMWFIWCMCSIIQPLKPPPPPSITVPESFPSENCGPEIWLVN